MLTLYIQQHTCVVMYYEVFKLVSSFAQEVLLNIHSMPSREAGKSVKIWNADNVNIMFMVCALLVIQG